MQQGKYRQMGLFSITSVGQSWRGADVIMGIARRFGHWNWGSVTGLSKPLLSGSLIKAPGFAGDTYITDKANDIQAMIWPRLIVGTALASALATTALAQDVTAGERPSTFAEPAASCCPVVSQVGAATSATWAVRLCLVAGSLR